MELLSLVSARGDEQRYLQDVAAVTAAPTATTQGTSTRSHRYLHLVGDCAFAGDFTVKMWGRYNLTYKDGAGDKQPSPWFVVDRFGTAGELTVAFGTPVSTEPLEILGLDNVFLEVTAVTGGGAANVWLAGNTY